MRVEIPEEISSRISSVASNAATIQALMKEVMKQDVHFGVIPGTGSKPTLLKPGAEVLLEAFGLHAIVDHANTVAENLSDGHRNFIVAVDVYDGDGVRVATGVGSCSTMEARYQYRNESTGTTVPSAYWDNRDSDLIGGKGFFPRKDKAGKWKIFTKVKHDNPADYWNTCLKMAKKRAFVDAAISSTGASDMFTQDIEEMVDLIAGEGNHTIDATGTSTTTTDAGSENKNANPALDSDTYTGIPSGVEKGATGQSGNRKWTRYDITFDDGTVIGTFSRSVAVKAHEMSKLGEPITVSLKHKGGRVAIKGIIDPDDGGEAGGEDDS